MTCLLCHRRRRQGLPACATHQGRRDPVDLLLGAVVLGGFAAVLALVALGWLAGGP